MWVILPGLVPAAVPADIGGAPRLRVETAKLLAGNHRLAEVSEALSGLAPDVLVLVELRPGALAQLRAGGAFDGLTHSTVEGTPQDVEIFSRLPLRDVGRAVGLPELPQPRAVVDVGAIPVRLRGAHPLPPVSGYEDESRASMAELADEVRAEALRCWWLAT